MKRIMIAVFVSAILVIAGFGVIKMFNSSATGSAIKSDVKEFTIEAFRFGYSPDVITVNKGDRVRIKIENTDTLHGIRIPDLNVRGNEEIEFIADKAGEFTWYCTNMCGSGHMQMQGKLIVK